MVEPVMEQPQCVVGPMRDYQLEGLRWLVSRVGDSGVNAILADEMVCLRLRPQKQVAPAHLHARAAAMSKPSFSALFAHADASRCPPKPSDNTKKRAAMLLIACCDLGVSPRKN